MNIFKYLWTKIKNFLYFLLYLFVVIFGAPFLRCKSKGKKNIKKDDEARVFVANHLEVYGPTVMHLHLPIKKKRFWIIDRMLNKESIEEQMRPGIMNENHFTWAPKWLKKCALKLMKGFVYYVLNYRVKNISVSRDESREIMKTFQQSVLALEKKENLVIFPEINYQDKGISEVYESFAILGKYYYKKTGKCLSYYPVYIDKDKKVMFIGNAMKYDPNDENSVKNIVNYTYKTINDFAGINDNEKV